MQVEMVNSSSDSECALSSARCRFAGDDVTMTSLRRINATSTSNDDIVASNWSDEWRRVTLATVAVTIIIITIVLGNSLVIIAIAADRRLKSVQNWFIASLAVSDLLVGMFIMPLSLANELVGYWPFGDVLCQLRALSTVAVHRCSTVHSVHSQSLPHQPRSLLVHHSCHLVSSQTDAQTCHVHDLHRLDPIRHHLFSAVGRVVEASAGCRRSPVVCA